MESSRSSEGGSFSVDLEEFLERRQGQGEPVNGTSPGTLVQLVSDISQPRAYRDWLRADCIRLARQIRLLGPFFEDLLEIKEFPGVVPDSLETALCHIRSWLQLCHCGSKIFLVTLEDLVVRGSRIFHMRLAHQIHRVLAKEHVRNKFVMAVTELEGALGNLPNTEQILCDDVREQVELGYAQMQRARLNASSSRIKNGDKELEVDVAIALSKDFRGQSCRAALGRLAEKLQLKTPLELEQETNALHRDVYDERIGKMEIRDQMYHLLGKLNSLAISELVKSDANCFVGDRVLEGCKEQVLLTEEEITVDSLIEKLKSDRADVRRYAAREIRLLAKQNTEQRVTIAEAGAIPLLVGLVCTEDHQMQEYTVAALLNLSIHEENKRLIVEAGAIDRLLDVLQSGSNDNTSAEARENSAATLFSLSVVDEFKVRIGQSVGAFSALLSLLRDGSLRGKKDAANALFNLVIYRGNKALAVRGGVVPILMRFLVEPSKEMVTEALAILALLATDPEGAAAIGNSSPITALIDFIRKSSPKNQENASAALLSLCENNPRHLFTLKQLGAQAALSILAQTGSTRAQKKATSILGLLKHKGRYESF